MAEWAKTGVDAAALHGSAQPLESKYQDHLLYTVRAAGGRTGKTTKSHVVCWADEKAEKCTSF